MQIRSAQLLPTARPQAFSASKARFGNNQDLQIKPDTSIGTDPQDPVFLAELKKVAVVLNEYDNAIRNGTVEFISAEDANPWQTSESNPVGNPRIQFKLNGQDHQLDINCLHHRDHTVFFSIMPNSREFKPFRELTFLHSPKNNLTNEHISFDCLDQDTISECQWVAGQPGRVNSISLQTPLANFPRPDMVKKAHDLGILLLTKIGESRKAQGLTTPLLPEPQKRLDETG